MIWAALLGAGIGAGLLLIARALFPPVAPLDQALAARTRPAAPEPITVAAEPGGWAGRHGRRLAPVLRAAGLPRASVRRDLKVLGRDVDRHLAEQATAAAAGLLIPPLLVLALQAVGILDAGVLVPITGSLTVGLILGLAPSRSVREDARARREEMRHTLSVVLDLTVVSLAGGAGVEQALVDAASVPQGWAATQIRRALSTAELTRVPPWETLGRLGAELEVRELVELAATVSLAGSEGAKVRASLTAKARGLRTRRLAEAQAAAGAATERMTLPLTVLFAGFLVFIGFPALAHITAGL